MKHSIIILIIGATMLFFNCSENQPTSPELNQSDLVTNTMAKKPAPKLIGEIYCLYEDNHPFYWVGTVDFGDGIPCGITYEALTAKDVGNVHHFTENFVIYNLNDPEEIYLSGSDFGVLAWSNLEGRMNGVVEVANPPYEEWLGRKVHMGGAVIMGPAGPFAFDGTIRIN